MSEGTGLVRKSLTGTVAALALAGAAVAVDFAPAGQAFGSPARATTPPSISSIDSSASELDLPKVEDPADRGWTGAPSAALIEASRIVADAADRHSEVFAGSEFARDYSALAIFTADPTAPAVAELKAALKGQPGAEEVVFKQVDYSMDELMAATDSIAMNEIAGATWVGPDVTTNSLTLGRDDSKGAGPAIGSTLRLSDPQVCSKKHPYGRSDGALTPDSDLQDMPVRVVRDQTVWTALEDR